MAESHAVARDAEERRAATRAHTLRRRLNQLHGIPIRIGNEANARAARRDVRFA
jgi:hypothetical protein